MNEWLCLFLSELCRGICASVEQNQRGWGKMDIHGGKIVRTCIISILGGVE